MEADDLRGLSLLEVAAHRVAYLRMQFPERVGHREDRGAERAGNVPAFGRFLSTRKMTSSMPSQPYYARPANDIRTGRHRGTRPGRRGRRLLTVSPSQ